MFLGRFLKKINWLGKSFFSNSRAPNSVILDLGNKKSVADRHAILAYWTRKNLLPFLLPHRFVIL